MSNSINTVARFVHVFARGARWYVTSGLCKFECVSEQHARALAAQLSKCVAEHNVDECME